MRGRSFVGAAVAFGALATGSAALAQVANYGFLRNTPISRFNEQDFKLYRAAVTQALVAPELGVPVTWRNDRSGSEGSVTAREGERPGCRVVVMENRHKALSARSEQQLCKVDGKWKATAG